jgi:hypothetical protein
MAVSKVGAVAARNRVGQLTADADVLFGRRQCVLGAARLEIPDAEVAQGSGESGLSATAPAPPMRAASSPRSAPAAAHSRARLCCRDTTAGDLAALYVPAMAVWCRSGFPVPGREVTGRRVRGGHLAAHPIQIVIY